jgi:hypothetical protein
MRKFDGEQTVAGLWFGTASSFINLQTSLGSGYLQSDALGVYTSGNTTYVVGDALSTSGGTHAILWAITEAPEPTVGMLWAGGMLMAVPGRWRRQILRSCR